jgi:4-amino-4-deoxychorismate lyase
MLTLTEQSAHPSLAGVFETMRVGDGQIPLIDWHLRRLSLGLKAFNIVDVSLVNLRQELQSMAKNLANSVLKLSIGYDSTQASQAAQIVLQSRSLPRKDDVTGIAIALSDVALKTPEHLVGLKILDRRRIDSARATMAQVDECLLRCAITEHWTCATMGNFFLIHGNTLRTPIIEHCGVRGVMRAMILHLASELNMDVRECCIKTDDLTNANSLFVCNAVRGIRPVRVLKTREGAHYFPGHRHIDRLQQALITVGFSP